MVRVDSGPPENVVRVERRLLENAVKVDSGPQENVRQVASGEPLEN